MNAFHICLYRAKLRVASYIILCPTSSKLETDPDDQQLNKTFIVASQTPGSVVHVSSNVIGGCACRDY